MLKLLNPGYKCTAVLVSAVILSFQYQTLLNISIFTVCMVLLIAERVSIKRILKILFPVIVAAAGLFMTGFLFSADSGTSLSLDIQKTIIYSDSVNSGLQISTRILAFAGLGMIFSLTTGMQEFIYSLNQQFHLPHRFAYGIMAAFHLGPLIPYEYKKTVQAFAARGQNFFPLSPKILIPFIIKSVRWSESLAAAMESKGFEQDGPRTCLHVMQVRWFDYAFFILSVGLTVLGCIFL